jgi:hypothetical protein
MNIITHDEYKSINECKCGGPVFKYHNSSKNTFHINCGYTKKVLEISKTFKKTWIVPKKIDCEWRCVYYGERPVFNEINEKIIKYVDHSKDLDQKLEHKLKILFSFLIVSKNSATLDEINILVKNNLLREPRKTFYLVSTGRFLKVSHYESFEEYRDRIFSKKIIDFNKPEVIEPIVKPVKLVKKKIKPQEISQFIVVSDDELSEENSDKSDESEVSETESDSDRDESDYESVEEFEEFEEFEENEYSDYED